MNQTSAVLRTPSHAWGALSLNFEEMQVGIMGQKKQRPGKSRTLRQNQYEHGRPLDQTDQSHSANCSDDS
jgi:hypothetical protein